VIIDKSSEGFMSTSSTVPALPLPGGLALGQPPDLPGVTVDSNGGINSQAVQTYTTTLTAAQVLALATTPVQLVPTGQEVATVAGSGFGKGLAILVKSVSLALNWLAGNTAYTLGGATLKLFQGPVANALPLTADMSSILTQTAISDDVGIAILPLGVQTQALTENQPILLAMSANPTLGNSTLSVTIEYTVIQTGTVLVG
jgi:hypothetical protein